MGLWKAGLPEFVLAVGRSAMDVELSAVVVFTEDVSAGELGFEIVQDWVDKYSLPMFRCCSL